MINPYYIFRLDLIAIRRTNRDFLLYFKVVYLKNSLIRSLSKYSNNILTVYKEVFVKHFNAASVFKTVNTISIFLIVLSRFYSVILSCYIY